MATIKVDILNPKALAILQNLADLNLISINEEGLDEILEKLRSKAEYAPSEEEILNEVREERAKRYGN
ncbi:MAG: hypothetical protein JXQ87_09630 [Bacteroidia bacterium]